METEAGSKPLLCLNDEDGDDDDDDDDASSSSTASWPLLEVFSCQKTQTGAFPTSCHVPLDQRRRTLVSMCVCVCVCVCAWEE